MELRRLIPFVIFVLSLSMLWTGWIEFNRPPAAPTAPTLAAAPNQASPASPASADVPTDGTVPSPSASFAANTPPASAPSAIAPRVKVVTDVLSADVSAEGGSIVRLELVSHRAKDDPANGFVILDDGREHIYEAESGLLGAGLPTHRSLFTLPAGDQTLADGADTLVVRLEAPEVDGLQIAKVLTFTRGSYLIDVAYEIHNARGEALTAQAYFQFLRDSKPAEQVGGFGVQTFTGPAFYTDAGKFQKVTFSDIAANKAKFPGTVVSDGWVAMVQHYFVSAWLPPRGREPQLCRRPPQGRRRPLHRRRAPPRRRCRGRNRPHLLAPLCRPAGTGQTRKRRAGAGTGG
jgi:YidC/Oxa1 family membrane protein insertase